MIWLLILPIGLLLLIVALVTIAAVLFTLFSLFVAVFPIPKVPLTYNLRNLQVRWRTIAFSSIAIVLVVGLLTMMLAFVKGMDRLTEESGNPANILILADGATDEAFSRLDPYGVQQLPQDVQNEVARTKDGEFLFTKEVYVIVTHIIEKSGDRGKGKAVEEKPIEGGKEDSREGTGGKRRFVQMRGVDNPVIAGLVHDITLKDFPGRPSRWFASTGEKEVVLGHGVARMFGHDLGKEIVMPGDTLKIGRWTWTVAGVMNPANSTFGSEVWVHDGFVQANFGRNNSYSSFVVQVKDPARCHAAAKALKDISGVSFTVAPETEYYAKLTATNEQFRKTFLFVAAVMAVGGALSVMITMFAAVSQRIRDIGVLRLLGYARWQVLCSFLVEALAIGVLGGILGIAIGSLCDGATASSIVSSGAGGGKTIVLRLTVDLSVVLTGMAFALVMSAVGGFLPAFNAMRLRPLESLR
jgi:ABC-type antimicrobial peptide transport system permease subunit